MQEELFAKFGYKKTFGVDVPLYVREQSKSFVYSDGEDAEMALLEKVRGLHDVSTRSRELSTPFPTWMEQYHLSPLRSNLLRPFESFLRGKRILEVGAGCGAISRFLGELGGNVVSLEGSLNRARIAAERCRDLPNVQIVCDTLSDFPDELQFDVVVVVGVLEYASVFLSETDPHAEFLRKIRSLTVDDGTLLLAIENQIGLKYFLGAPEDHLNQPMIGLEGRYKAGGPRTFTHDSLRDLVEKAGFSSTYVHSPVPDYKLVTGLITDEGLKSRDLDWSPILGHSILTDRSRPQGLPFSPTLAWRTLQDADLLTDLSNSFLLEASPVDKSSALAGSLGYHFGSLRLSPYRRTKRFVKSSPGEVISVIESVTEPLASLESQPAMVLQKDAESSSYIQGENYVLFFERGIADRATTERDFIELLRSFLGDALSAVGVQLTDQELLNCAGRMLPGDLFDLIPRNVIRQTHERSQAFDLEWVLDGELELGHLLFRIVLSLMNSFEALGARSDWLRSKGRLSRFDFILDLLSTFDISSDDLARYAALESKVSETIVPGTAAGFLPFLRERMDFGESFNIELKGWDLEEEKATLSHFKSEASNLEAELKSANLSVLQSELRTRGLEAHGRLLSESLSDARAELGDIKNSKSWRWTRPLRLLHSALTSRRP